MQDIYLLSGSNLGQREDYLSHALELIKKQAGFVVSSSVYESGAWGYRSERKFLNQCISIHSGLSPLDLLNFLKSIERDCGREEKAGSYKDRSLDIDILYYGNDIIEEEELTIPHPRLHLRAFTLVPLTEIAPHFIHPIFNKTSKELLAICPDKNIPVKKY